MSKLRQAKLTSNGVQDLMLLGVRANGAVKGRLLAMNLEQRFRNSSDTNTEITYTFPLPFGAVLMGVDVVLNGKSLKGEVTAKSTARARYEEALSEGNSSIMLERNPDHSYTLELGNLMAREECSITVRYAQVLQVEQGQIRLMLPTTIAPRYGNPITEGGLQPHQANVTDLTAEYPFDISLTLYGDLAKANVASPSHATGYFPNGEELVVRLAQRGALDRDFILTLSDLLNKSSVISCEDSCVPGQTAVMANFSPAPALTEQGTNAVSAKILVDCSGSMSGDSIESARRALRSIINGLEKADYFSLSRFGSSVEHRSRGMWNAAPPARASAQRWIDTVSADLGGTEMAEALKSTIAINHKVKSDILLITDGEISGIDEVIKIAKKSGHRVFVVAIGASPAEAHLRRLALATGGACDFVAPGEDVEPAVLRMFHRLRATQLKGLRVEWPSTMTLRWVQTLPNGAFVNDAMSVCAFIETPSAPELGEVKLWGRLDDAQDEVLLGRATVGHVESTVNTLARVAASALYVETSVEKDALGGTKRQPTAQEVAVLYQLVTDKTNFILVHERTEEEKALEMPDGHVVPQMLAAGWGGTGTVARSTSGAQRSDIQFSMADDYSSLSSCASSVRFRSSDSSSAPSFSVCEPVPSIWRSNRSNAAAKVDALSSGGMDDFQIPAFLRKQADDEPHERTQTRRSIDKLNPAFWRGASATDASQAKYLSPAFYTGITPAGLAEWLRINHQSLWPATYGELRDIGLGLAICEWLEFEVGADAAEQMVVATFIAVVRELGFVKLHGLQKTVQAIKGVVSPQETTTLDANLASKIRNGLQEIQPGKWPNSVVNFPESAMA